MAYEELAFSSSHRRVGGADVRPRRTPGRQGCRRNAFHSRNGAKNVTITRNGSVLAAFTFPKATVMSVRDEHGNPPRLDGGPYEFHGAFELRAMTTGDVPASAWRGMAAAELLSHPPMVIQAEGVDVILETASGQ